MRPGWLWAARRTLGGCAFEAGRHAFDRGQLSLPPESRAQAVRGACVLQSCSSDLSCYALSLINSNKMSGAESRIPASSAMGGVIWAATYYFQARRQIRFGYVFSCSDECECKRHVCGKQQQLPPHKPSHSKCSSRMPSSPRSKRARASLMSCRHSLRLFTRTC
ncbi:uncharacterized protein LAESUDRAFT_463998 [Laetiporus sulphureus 93-53]|uniref:Uncharacterized protein n=1 Tax=Laetiporus sulphureus 93-53 TaxID=1314785 RepID=A0A165G6E8_9APHY|nr:uncharacterized protein LAESUDRAFT_463998 [Laetiporus sulphureus 93-53]KZT09889.1 hypothetical protein LAESUDRAFT_463998 [Laetiporus sulphureus 93-53]